MPILDLQNMFTANSIPVAAGNAANTSIGDPMINAFGASQYFSSNAIDMWNGNSAIPVPPLGGPEIFDFGRGRPVETFIEIVFACVGATATVQFQLIAADTVATLPSTAGTNANILTQTGLIPVAQLVAGYSPRILGIPAGLVNSNGATARWLSLAYVIGTASLTAGVFSAGLVYDDVSNVPTL
jgi:hypothetical protein